MTHHITDEQIDEATKDIGLQSPFARYRIARAVLALAEPAPHGAIDLLSEFSEAMSDSGDWPDTYDERTRLKSLVDRVRFYLKPAEQWATVPKGGEEWSTVPKGYTAPAPAVPGTAREFVEWMKAQPEDRDPTTIDGALAEFEAQVSPQPQAPAVSSDVLREMREFGKARMAEFMGAHHMALVLSQKINEWADKLTAAPTPPAQGEPKLIGWRTENFLWETDDVDKARNWEPNIGVLPIFDGDPNTNLGSAGIATLPPEQSVDLLERCAKWCDEQARSDWCGRRASDMVRAFAATTKAAQPAVPESADSVAPVQLGELAKRNIYDAIRGAYDLGYNDARNARAVPGDSAPGYDGRNVEADHGGALLNSLNQRLRSAPAVPESAGVASEQVATSLTPTQIDDIINAGGYRNAAGGIYETSVYRFATDIEAAIKNATQPAVPEDVARDAKRYRWLRDMASQDWLHRNHNYQNLRGAAFDAAIDAARAAGGAA